MDDLRIPKEKDELIAETEKIIEENKSLYEQGLLQNMKGSLKAIELWTASNPNLKIGEQSV